jgi:universal stress protein E
MDRFRKILVCVDGRSGSPEAVERSVRLAKETGATLRLVAVVPELPRYLRYPHFEYPALSETLLAEAREQLVSLADEVRGAGVQAESAALYGKPFLAISREVLREGHDLVVLPADPEGGSGLSSSTAMRLFRVCPCPVLAVKPGVSGPFSRILAAVDAEATDDAGGALQRAILDTSLWLGERDAAIVDALYAWGGEHRAMERFAQLMEQVGQQAASAFDGLLSAYADRLPPERRKLIEGDPVRVIPDYVREHGVDLLTIGTLVRTGVAGLLIGNTAEKILGEVDCSILALKPVGFVSPVELD